MKNIEKYIEGNLNQLSRINFERKMEKDKNFRQIVNLYKNVDIVMQGAFLAAEAEIEMIRKKIDIVAAGFVTDFYSDKGSSGNIKEFLSWS
jgi:hypothetical protein